MIVILRMAAMLHFEGARDFKIPPAALWPKLRDAGFLAGCIPDASVEGTPSRDKAVCSVRPGFAFVSGSLEVNIQIVDGTEPAALKFQLLSKGIGSSSDVETSLTLAASDAGTRIHWSADVIRLGGLLKMVPSGLMKGAAQKVIEDVWTGVERRVSGEE